MVVRRKRRRKRRRSAQGRLLSFERQTSGGGHDAYIHLKRVEG